MPLENWYPISAATHTLPYDQWTNVGGANKNASATVGGGRAGPATHDDDTSHIDEGSGGGGLNRLQSLNPDWPGPIGEFLGINANFRTKTSGGASTRELFISNAGGTLATAILTAATSDAGYINTGPIDFTTAATYRPGGGASWLISDFADDQTMFPTIKVSVSNNTVCTSIWGQLSYNPPSGGFAFLLQLAGLAALPIVGHLADIGQFRAYLAWRRRVHPRHTILTGAEVERAWAEIRAYRHPTFFLPAVAR